MRWRPRPGSRAFPRPGRSATMSLMLLLPAVAPMVGRDHELGVLAQELAVASAGHTRAVLVAGEAGIGKTRLVTELAGRAAGDALVAVGHCVQLGREGAPYGPMIGALRMVLHELGVPDAVSALGGGRGVLARLLPELGGTEVTDAGRGRLFEAVARALAPLFFIIKNWCPLRSGSILNSPALTPSGTS